MRILRSFSFYILAVMSGLVLSCGEEVTVEAPPEPEQLSLKVFGTGSGLPSNDVFDILVDSQSRKWFSTSEGVGMLENGTMTVFDLRNGLPNRKCRSIAEFNGKIWVATWGGGVAVYDGSTWSTLTVTDGLLSGRVFDIAVDTASIWFATIEGVSQYQDRDDIPMNQRWVSYTEKRNRNTWTPQDKGILLEANTATVEVAYDTSRGLEIWFGATYSGVTVWSPSDQTARYYMDTNSGLPGSAINDIFYESTEDLFWIGTSSDGLVSVDVNNGIWTRYRHEDGLPSDVIYSIMADSSGTIWVGTQAGLAKQSGSSFKGYTTASGLPAPRLRKVYVDEQNRVWMGFIEGGAAYIK